MSSAPSPRRCADCGADNQGFATFCHECGEPLDEHARPLPGGADAAAAARPRALRWEVWLGLALVVGVLGFALADWGQREAEAQLYRTGVEAATAHHWDAAATAFAGLGTYRDAAKWRDEAAHAILLRDTTYIAGNDAAAFRDWITAYRALSQTVAIEPGYRNAQALFDSATREAPRQALAGTILRRTDGDHPGLYVRQDDGSEWRLAGSDAQSALWATDPAPGHILYDAPDPPGTPAAPRSDALVSVIRRLPPGRHLQVTDVQRPDEPPRVLPLSFGDGGYVLLGPRGVWSANPGTEEPARGYAGPLVGLHLGSVSYYDYETGVLTPNLGTTPGTFLLDADPVGQQLLLGQYDSVGTPQPRTRLYIPAEGRLQRVDTVAGTVLAAELSPDKNGLLYTTTVGQAGAGGVRADLLWEDLTHPERDDELLRSQTYVLTPSVADWLRGRIVPGQPTRVLIQDTQGARHRLYLRDVMSGTERLLWEVPGQIMLRRYWLSSDGAMLFLEEVPYRDDNDVTLVAQPLDEGSAPLRVPLPPEGTGRPFLLDAQPDRTGLLLRALYDTEQAQQNAPPPPSYEERLYHAAATGAITTPLLLGQEAILVEDIIVNLAPQLQVLPARLVAYPRPDGLHLRTLDGTATLPPVPGVTAVWTLTPERSPLFWGR